MNRIDHIVFTNEFIKNTSKLKDFVSFVEIILGSRIQEALGIPLSSKEHFFYEYRSSFWKKSDNCKIQNINILLMSVSLKYQLNMWGTWELGRLWLLLTGHFSDFNIKFPNMWVFMSPQMEKKKITRIMQVIELYLCKHFEGLFLPISLDSFKKQEKDRWNKVWKNNNIFSPCNLLHQEAFPCSCDYYITTWLLTITVTVGKVKAQHGAISIKRIWNSLASSEAACLLWGRTQKYISIYLRCCFKEHPKLHHYFI